ncbi:MAG: Rho termination factor N-terminal domain-containing protein, partial [Chloroflexi bacterium]|nr:Rho termination factor N-terminal domain-containing protein [Chloroflexota bacterium]
MNLGELEGKNKQELLTIAKEMGIENGLASIMRKDEVAFRVLQAYAEQQGYILASGVLELINEGYGFLRQPSLKPSANDVYVSQSQIRRFALRTGDQVMGQVRPPKDSEKYYGLVRVEGVNGMDPEVARQRPQFDGRTPIFPDTQIKLETTKNNLSTRLIDLLAPIGRGQRGLIVSPPKAGKTTLLKHIAQGIS